MRKFLYSAIIWSLVIWTIYSLGEGWYITSLVENDVSGDATAQLLERMGNDPAAQLTRQMIANPSSRGAFVSSFVESMWETRLWFWLAPTVGFGIIALLLRPISSSNAADKNDAQSRES